MNTTSLEQFVALNPTELASVEGGNKGIECLKGFGTGIGLGMLGGAATLGPIGMIPGYFVGVYAGTAFCIGRAVG